MTKFLLSIILIAAAIYVFFGPTKGRLADATPLKAERADLEEALENVKKIQAKREALSGQYNSFQGNHLDRLEKMLPGHVDNVRLAIDINKMASDVGMSLKDIDIRALSGENSTRARNQISEATTVGGLSYLDFRFVVSGPYEGMKILMSDLARSIRIVDITELEFTSQDVNLFDFNVGLRTYWQNESL